MKITYLGHSCFWIETNGKQLLFDPFVSGNPAAKEIDIQGITTDYILISHGHGDHCADAEAIGKMNKATVISNYEVVTWYERKGLKGHSMNHGGKWKFDFGTVKYVNAVHSSSLPDGSNGGNPGGFVVWNDEICLYHAGDTALTEDMKLIPLTCPKVDFAFLPVGDNYTMGYEDAAIAAEFIQCKNIIGCHFDTFAPIKIDHEKAVAAFKKRGIQLQLMGIGETILA